MPVQRAMPLAFCHDLMARNFETQYMLGDSLLVAPIVRAGGNVDVYLPMISEGDRRGWYDYWTGVRLRAGQVVRFRDLPWDRVPVFVREGAAVAYAPVHDRAQDWTGDIEIAEVAICGTPDFTIPATVRWVNRDGKTAVGGAARLKRF